MTEQELRNKVVSAATAWLGCKVSDGSHRKIIDLYNSHAPLARGYKVSYTDPWCAAFASAVAIKCGLTDIMPTECSCALLIAQYKALGCWVENDAYVPAPGDLILYDWDDSGAGDCTGAPEHVGIVIDVSGRAVITVIEGNKGNAVGYRTMQVNGRYIRGYCVPDYAEKAAALSAAAAKKEEIDMTNAEVQAMIHTAVQSALADRDNSDQKVAQNTSTWASTAWNKAVRAGIFDGSCPGGTFTREQAAVVLDRLGLI